MMATPFQEDGSLDEVAVRTNVERLADARQGVYLGSGGAGEGHVLSRQELRRLYDIGVQAAKGRVTVCANPRESRTAADMYAVAKEAVAAGVDMVQLYQLDGGHGMIPTQLEQAQYFNELLPELNHPVAISIHALAGYRPTVKFVQDLCSRYPQIEAINLMHASTSNFVELRDALPERIRIYTIVTNMIQILALGADGVLMAENNIIPNICQRTLEAYEAGDIAALSEGMLTIQRFDNIVNRWMPSTARWVKMAMKVLGLGNGVLRLPYLLPPQEELDKMAAGFEALKIRQLEGMEAPY
jgi:4-hydroxy-tetrahydrodipicolinate synthase